MNSNFQYYNHLGFFNPFYFSTDKGLIINSNFKETVERRNMVNKLNVAAVIENLLGRNILGDRTIIEGINKTPWMAKPNADSTDWSYYEVPDHNEKMMDQNEMAIQFLNLLKEEVYNYIKDKKTIGVLLTGGMDSRIIAGVLDLLIKDNIINNVSVIALTWGDLNSRDAVYAKKIAEKLNWEWRHFSLTSEDLKKNIEAVAKRGSEYPPIHLHAMLKVREEKDLDCILAGSYGDSIGRAEYAGRRVTNLLDMRDKIKNPNGFLKRSVLDIYTDDINSDIDFYWNKFPQNKSYQQLEQDYQIHYMRRKLNPCLSVINEKTPLYQVFSDPNVFGFIWSIHPKLRNNEIYKIILNNFKTDLSEIPWARNGLIFDKTKGEPDAYSKNYHAHSEYINNDLNDFIKDLVLSNNIEKMNILNLSSIENYFKLMKKKFYLRNTKVEEKIIWLASLSRSVDLYDIKENYFDTGMSFYDKLNSLSPIKENLLDQAKSYYVKSVRNRSN